MKNAMNASLLGILCMFAQNILPAQAKSTEGASLVNLADTLIEQGRGDEAEAAYRLALQNDPRLFDAMAGIGLTKLLKGQLPEAQRDFYHTLEEDYRNARAHYGLGISYFRQGNFSEAAREFNKSLFENTRNADAHFMLAETFRAQGNQHAAVPEYREAARLNPERAANYYLGTIGSIARPTQQTVAAEAAQDPRKIIPGSAPESGAID